MKKKITLFLSIPTLLFSLASCGDNPGGDSTNEPIVLSYGEICTNYTGFCEELPLRAPENSVDGLYDWVAENRSFVLIVTKKEACGCWEDFEPIVSRANTDYNLGIRYIYMEDLPIDNPFNIYVESKVKMPTICFFNNGVLKKQILYSGDNEAYKDYNAFINLLKKNVIFPKRYMISMDDLDKYIESNKEFTIYYNRNACPDCTLMDTNYLNPWSSGNFTVNDPLLVFDFQPYYPKRPKDTDPQEAWDEYNEKLKDYNDYKKKYGLSYSEDVNPIFGFETGAVPTFQRRKGNEILDMIVTLNDSYNKETLKMDVTYFTRERVNAMPSLLEKEKYILSDYTFTEEQVKDRTTYRNTQYSIQFAAFEQFFKTYVK